MLRGSLNAISTACRVIFPLLLLVALTGCGKSPQASATGNQAVETKSRFVVPDGTPEEILEFVDNLRDQRPEFPSRKHRIEYTRLFVTTMIAAGDKILAQEADDAILREAVRVKLSASLQLPADPGLSASLAQLLAKDVLSNVRELMDDKRPAVASEAAFYFVPARSFLLTSMRPAERTSLAEEAIQSVIDTKYAQQSIANVNLLTDQMIRIGDNEEAVDACVQIADILGNQADETLVEIASVFRAKANRIRLPGSLLELEGPTLDGREFDWSSYRGKVVLIDFWASWCGPCVSEIPSVLSQYHRYHARGFDVVGVCLDRRREEAEAYLQKSPLPWVQLYTDPDSSKRSQHPLAKRYGISSIPAAFLVDREGKVISTDARGPELRRKLQDLFD